MPPRSCDVAVGQYEIRELTFANNGDCVKMRKTSRAASGMFGLHSGIIDTLRRCRLTLFLLCEPACSLQPLILSVVLFSEMQMLNSTKDGLSVEQVVHHNLMRQEGI